MKKLISLLLCAIMLLSLCACGGEEAETNNNQDETLKPTIDPDAPLSDGKTLKLLAITSSFGLNTTQFLYDIAVAEGATEVVVGRLYASGCTLRSHVDNARKDVCAYTYTKNDSGEWVTVESANMLYGLQDEDWDIIFMQQSAADAGRRDTYGNYINELMDYVNKHKTNPNARYIWNMTWAYQADTDQAVFLEFGSDQMAMYQAIVDATKEHVIPRTDFTAINPTGTAIQNARTSYFGDHLTKDTYHLNNLGRAVAGYMLYATLTDKDLTEVNLGEISSYDIRGTLVLSDKDRQVIIESVNNARSNPYTVTPSAITEA